MNKLHLILPMAGRGSRFFKNGFVCPKPLIEINGKPFFYWAARSVEKFVDCADLTFVVLEEHIRDFAIDEKIKAYWPAARIVALLEVTEGAAVTALKGCEAIILLNKCDLDRADDLYDLYRAAGFQTLRVSAETGEGLEELKPLIAGKLSAFTGNSGVGKSSILNALDPAFDLKVGEISEALGRGRHTTRHVELFKLSCGAEIVDSPGFSSFETDELNLEWKRRLPETFREFAPYLGQCRFVGCSHTKEKGCAVLEAVRRGDIQKKRHESYLRLYEELKPLKDWQENKK